MRGQDFTGQDLKNRNFREQDLRNCRLVDCDLRGADLRRANLSFADLTGARLEDAKLLGAIMHDTVGAMRNGGKVISIIGLDYPILIDGADTVFGCQKISTKSTELPREVLLRMDRAVAVKFHDLGSALLRWYRSKG